MYGKILLGELYITTSFNAVVAYERTCIGVNMIVFEEGDMPLVLNTEFVWDSDYITFQPGGILKTTVL